MAQACLQPTPGRVVGQQNNTHIPLLVIRMGGPPSAGCAGLTGLRNTTHPLRAVPDRRGGESGLYTIVWRIRIMTSQSFSLDGCVLKTPGFPVSILRRGAEPHVLLSPKRVPIRRHCGSRNPLGCVLSLSTLCWCQDGEFALGALTCRADTPEDRRPMLVRNLLYRSMIWTRVLRQHLPLEQVSCNKKAIIPSQAVATGEFIQVPMVPTSK